ncbi:MAG: hypothetical protein ACTSX8_10695, partial [Alphaproteobacteria bacterium]
MEPPRGMLALTIAALPEMYDVEQNDIGWNPALLVGEHARVVGTAGKAFDKYLRLLHAVGTEQTTPDDALAALGFEAVLNSAALLLSTEEQEEEESAAAAAPASRPLYTATSGPPRTTVVAQRRAAEADARTEVLKRHRRFLVYAGGDKAAYTPRIGAGASVIRLEDLLRRVNAADALTPDLKEVEYQILSLSVPPTDMRPESDFAFKATDELLYHETTADKPDPSLPKALKTQMKDAKKSIKKGARGWSAVVAILGNYLLRARDQTFVQRMQPLTNAVGAKISALVEFNGLDLWRYPSPGYHSAVVETVVTVKKRTVADARQFFNDIFLRDVGHTKLGSREILHKDQHTLALSYALVRDVLFMVYHTHAEMLRRADANADRAEWDALLRQKFDVRVEQAGGTDVNQQPIYMLHARFVNALRSAIGAFKDRTDDKQRIADNYELGQRGLALVGAYKATFVPSAGATKEKEKEKPAAESSEGVLHRIANVLWRNAAFPIQIATGANPMQVASALNAASTTGIEYLIPALSEAHTGDEPDIKSRATEQSYWWRFVFNVGVNLSIGALSRWMPRLNPLITSLEFLPGIFLPGRPLLDLARVTIGDLTKSSEFPWIVYREQKSYEDVLGVIKAFKDLAGPTLSVLPDEDVLAFIRWRGPSIHLKPDQRTGT